MGYLNGMQPLLMLIVTSVVFLTCQNVSCEKAVAGNLVGLQIEWSHSYTRASVNGLWCVHGNCTAGLLHCDIDKYQRAPSIIYRDFAFSHPDCVHVANWPDLSAARESSSQYWPACWLSIHLNFHVEAESKVLLHATHTQFHTSLCNYPY